MEYLSFSFWSKSSKCDQLGGQRLKGGMQRQQQQKECGQKQYAVTDTAGGAYEKNMGSFINIKREQQQQSSNKNS